MKTNTTSITSYGDITKKTTDQVVVNGKMVAQRLGKTAWEVYINHQLVINDEEGTTMHNANYVRVDGVLTYSNAVNAFITDAYTASERESALRKGILNAEDEDYVEFNNFAEGVKKAVEWLKK